MQNISSIYFDIWKNDLSWVLKKFQDWRFNTRFYFLKVFIFFIFINDVAYWFAIATAFPEIIFGEDFLHYSKVQVPVAILGALFDSFSLYITIWVVQRALLSRSNFSYVSHLSIDLLIAIAATFWVLFVFSVSAWIISFIPTEPKVQIHTEMQVKPQMKKQSLVDRGEIYEGRVVAAIKNPTGDHEMRNIYFGLVMGFSAIIPTAMHMLCAIFSLCLFFLRENT
ncbi:MAG: hypothetical protein H8E32_01525 [Nitrospinae bacterium]|nr:hypothetical protein [Nitrospinota bacterium]